MGFIYFMGIISSLCALFSSLDMTFDIPWNKYENYTLVLNGWDFLVHKQKEW